MTGAKKGVTDQMRFMAKVKIMPDGCWIWQGSKTNAGYGKFWLRGKDVSAHRASFLFAYGKIPSGKVVCHKCDVRLCVNPNHLFSETQALNLLDMTLKGRSAKGDRNGRRLHPESVPRGEMVWNAKVTNEMAQEIRRLADEKIMSRSEIRKEFNLSKSTVQRIITRFSWNNVTGEIS